MARFVKSEKHRRKPSRNVARATFFSRECGNRESGAGFIRLPDSRLTTPDCICGSCHIRLGVRKMMPELAEKPENTDLAGNDASTTAHPASRFFEKIQTAILPASRPASR